MLALRSERVMIFAGPCSPRFTADTLVVSVNVGEGGPGEALRFPCEFVASVKGRRGRDFGIWEQGFGLVTEGGRRKGRGVGCTVGAFAGRFRWPQVVSARYAQYQYGHYCEYPVPNQRSNRTHHTNNISTPRLWEKNKTESTCGGVVHIEREKTGASSRRDLLGQRQHCTL